MMYEYIAVHLNLTVSLTVSTFPLTWPQAELRPQRGGILLFQELV